MPQRCRHLAIVAAAPILAGCVAVPTSTPSASGGAPRILIVTTSQSTMGPAAEATGLFLSEAAHPWHVFTKAGFEVVIASPSGGPAPVDPRSLDLSDDSNRAFLEAIGIADGTAWRLGATVPLDEIEPADFDAVFFAGGHGTMWDFPNLESVRRVAETIHAEGGVVAAVCHGPAALVGVRDEAGRPIVEGRRVTSFTDREEMAVGLVEAMPFLLESRLRDLGAEFHGADDFEANVVVDDRIVTGQNPASATGVAEAVASIVVASSGDG